MAHMVSRNAWTPIATMVITRRVEDCTAIIWLATADVAAVIIRIGRAGEAVGSDDFLVLCQFSNSVNFRNRTQHCRRHILAVD